LIVNHETKETKEKTMKKTTTAITALAFAGSIFMTGQAMSAGDMNKTGESKTFQESGQIGQAERRVGQRDQANQMDRTSPTDRLGQTSQTDQLGQTGQTDPFGVRSFGQSSQVSKLMDKEVQGRDGKNLGKVSDLIVNQEGQIDYLIISRGGLMGMGESLVPIPWDSVQQTGGEEALIVTVDENRLNDAPTFSENEFGQPGWDTEVRGYYGEGQRGIQSDTGLEQDTEFDTEFEKDTEFEQNLDSQEGTDLGQDRRHKIDREPQE
jgi:sporulation protein YlmC with PRC-barrel domain